MYTSEQQIEDFIREYMRSRVVAETTVRAVLRRAVEHEDKYHKHFYEFTEDDLIITYADDWKIPTAATTVTKDDLTLPEEIKTSKLNVIIVFTKSSHSCYIFS